jgi:hypothetical protein
MESSSGTLVSLGIAMLPMLATFKRWSERKAEEHRETSERIEREKQSCPTESE